MGMYIPPRLSYYVCTVDLHRYVPTTPDVCLGRWFFSVGRYFWVLQYVHRYSIDTVRTLSVGVSQMTQAQAAGCDTHTPLYIFIFSNKVHITSTFVHGRAIRFKRRSIAWDESHLALPYKQVLQA